MVGIYMFTNRCTGKSYIGQSKDIDRRYKDHRFRTDEDSLFHRELRYYGFHNFDFCVLEECCVHELNDKEIHYIKEYNTLFPSGYNVSPGGTLPHTNTLKSFDDVEAIIGLLRENTMTNIQIAEMYGISDQMVSDINCGRCWRQDGLNYPIRDGRHKRVCIDEQFNRAWFSKQRVCINCGRIITNTSTTGLCRSCFDLDIASHIPTKQDLEIELRNGSFESVARKYGVSSKAVRRWCDKYGMSRHAKDYIS